MSDASLDVRHTVRRIVRAPGFTAVVLLTLAVGTAAATAIFSVVKAVLLEPLPFPQSEQLVRIVETIPADETAGAIAEERIVMEEQQFFLWRTVTNTLSQMAAYVSSSTSVTTAEGAARSVVARVSPAMFSMLGARMKLGRPLLQTDERMDSRVVVASADAWSEYFGASPDVIGRTVVLEGAGHIVVGVLAEGFDFPSPQTQFWVPLRQGPPVPGGERFVNVVARLRDDASLQEATAEANVIGVRVGASTSRAPVAPQAPRFRVQRLHDQLTAPVIPALRLFTVAALFVVLIVITNAATLLLSRNTHRRQELLIERALGASRGRVIRRVIIESVMFGLGGAIVGMALSYASVELLKTMARVDVPELFQLAAQQRFGTGSVFPRIDEIQIDAIVLTFAVAIAVLASVIAGSAPALQIVRDERAPFSGNDVSGGFSRMSKRSARNALVVGQVVVATMLLVSAVLLIRSFVEMLNVPRGYDPTNVLSFQLVLPQEYPLSRKETLAHDLASRLSALPNVESAGFASLPPLAGGVFAYGVFQPPGRTMQEMLRDAAAPQARSVSWNYLQAMGVRLLAGRWFDEGDAAGKKQVLLVTRTLARRYFGMSSPVGVQVRLPPGPDPWTIVGVVDDIHNGMPWEEGSSQFFMDSRQTLGAMPHLPERMRETAALGFLSYAVRVNGDPAGIVPDVRAVLRQLDRAAALDGLMPLREIVAGTLSRPRFYAVWSGLFAVVAGVLGIIGVYATVAYATSQRTREIGIRIALGAQRSHVWRLVVSHGTGLAFLGVAIGLGGALVLSRSLAAMLFGVTTADPLTYGVVGLGFFGIAAAASFVPASRATRVDPLIAIRHE